MKYFVAVALIATVASAFVIPMPVVQPTDQDQEIQQIVAAINNPSTDPATAAALEQMLIDVLGLSPSPVIVGPAIIEESPISVGPVIVDQSPISIGPAIVDQSPISIGPAIVDFPVFEDGLTQPPQVPAPVATPQPAASSPLVQIIVNVNQAPADAVVVEGIPAGIAPVPEPSPVIVVEQPETVVAQPPIPGPAILPTPVLPEVIAPGPVVVPQPIDNYEPIIVVEPVIPVQPEPVIVVNPSPAVTLPEELN